MVLRGEYILKKFNLSLLIRRFNIIKLLKIALQGKELGISTS